MDDVSLHDILTLARQESAQLYHYFIGVEHLFIALTQLKDGITSAILEYFSLSPRFVRYSIRESVGRYEDRRYWAGFPETPRARTVLEMAASLAGDRSPSERELLLAILSENDNVVTRTLREIGADVGAMIEVVSHWFTPLKPKTPDVPIAGAVQLDGEQVRVLQSMFRDYSQVEVVRELAGGYSGARVLLVHPTRVDGLKDAPVVVKLDDRQAILYERRRYDLYVKGTLPAATARLVDSPVVPDDLAIGGLKYTFVGRIEDTDPVSLREVAAGEDLEKVSDLVWGMYESFGPSWWRQRTPYRFAMWQEYEHVLPPALVVEAVEVAPSLEQGAARILKPYGPWSRSRQVMPGEIVALQGFAVQKVDMGSHVLHLAAGVQPEAMHRSGKVEVRGIDLSNTAHFRGEVVEQIWGRVVRTREDLLLRAVHRLEPYFDLRSATIPSLSPTIGDLPNPLALVDRMLERQVRGYLSTIHGDLHLGNILIGPRGDAWLIDFAWTRDGHTLFDWALLEISLLVEMVSPRAPRGWEGAWETIGRLAAIDRGETSVRNAAHPAARGLGVVADVREIVAQCLGEVGRWSEYYMALAFLALRAMTWRAEHIDGRRLAFLVAALCMDHLQSGSRRRDEGSGSSGGTTSDLDKTEVRTDDDLSSSG